MNNLLLLITLLLTLLAGCKKEEPTYHRDIFRCKVNGVEWVATCPTDGLFGCNPIDCQYYWKDTKGFEIGAISRNNDKTLNQSVAFFARPVVVGDNSSFFPAIHNYMDFNKSGCIGHVMDMSFDNKLTILEIDTVRYIIKGTFEFAAINDCQDTVHISDGYFHVNFRF